MEKKYKIDSIVIDTGILYALADKNDSWHKKAVDFVDSFKGRLILPSTVIPEVCCLFNTYLGQAVEIEFINSLINKGLTMEHFSIPDLTRCVELLDKYSDLNIGFVDASLVSIAERLKIGKLLTTDRRHFSSVKPRHVDHFLLLP